MHAEGVKELSPGWSVAEPWVIELTGAAQKERKRRAILSQSVATDKKYQAFMAFLPDEILALFRARPRFLTSTPGFRYAPPWPKFSYAFGGPLSVQLDNQLSPSAQTLYTYRRYRC